MKIPKEEQETIILYNESEEEASIYTMNKSMTRRLAQFTSKHPDLARLNRRYSDGAVEYLLDKHCVVVKLIEPARKEVQKEAVE